MSKISLSTPYKKGFSRTRRNRGIVLSDVDGTLVKGSVVLGHAVSLHKNGVLDLGDLPAKWMKDQKNESVIKDLAEAYREGIIGKTEAEIMADEYVNRLVSNPANFYSTMWRLRSLRGTGTRVVLVSGSPSFLVDRFARHYGFDSQASHYYQDPFGRFTGGCDGMFTGAAKKKYLGRLHLSRYPSITAFGDTQSDLPLFERAGYRVLVEPNSQTRSVIGHMANEIVHH